MRINIIRYSSLSYVYKHDSPYKRVEVNLYLLYIPDLIDSELKYLCQSLSNNSEPEFTDKEVINIYLYVMQVEQRLKIIQMHSFANSYLRSWFQSLHSNEAFVFRINRLSKVFKHLSSLLLSNYYPNDCQTDTILVDFLPIITVSGKRPNTVAKELTDKAFFSTISMYYHGLKLRAKAFSTHAHLPFTESLIVTLESENDLNVQKKVLEQFL